MEKLLDHFKQADITTEFNFDVISDQPFSWDKIFDRERHDPFRPGGEIFTGGFDGTLIARLIAPGGEERYGREILVYNTKCEELFCYPIPEKCKDVFFHIAPNDHLYVLTDNGNFMCFFNGRLLYRREWARSVCAAAFWEDGVVFMSVRRDGITICADICWSEGFTEPMVMHEGVPFEIINVFRCIPPGYTESGKPIVFASSYDEKLHIYNETEFFEVDIGVGDILGFEFSSQYDFIGFVCKDNIITIADASLTRTFLTVRMNDVEVFRQMAWIGNDCPVVVYDESVIILSVTGESKEVDMNGTTGIPVVFTCSDCCVVVRNEAVFSLKAIQKELSDVIGVVPSPTPAQRLVTGFRARCSTAILALQQENNLVEAVIGCMMAATQVDAVHWQKLLLTAAAFGRVYLEGTRTMEERKNLEKFSRIVQVLRICNAFRTDLNTYLTARQMLQIMENGCLDNLILRICGRGKFALALTICDYLNCNKKPIMTEWVCSAMRNVTEQSMDRALEFLHSKMQMDFFDANAVVSQLCIEGKREIALRIADRSPPANVIQFFVEIREWKKAIEACVRAADTSMFINVVKQAIKADNEQVKAHIRRNFTSFSVISKLVGSNKDNPLWGIVHRCEENPVTMETLIRKRVREVAQQVEENHLGEFLKLMESKTIDLASKYSSECPWMVQVRDLTAHVVKVREAEEVTVQEMHNKQYLDRPVNQALRELIMEGRLDVAEELAKGSGVSTRKLYQMAARLFIDSDWERFLKLSNEKFKQVWQFCVTLILLKFYSTNKALGKEKALQFIDQIKSEKKAKELRANLNKVIENRNWQAVVPSMKIFT